MYQPMTEDEIKTERMWFKICSEKDWKEKNR